MKIELGSEVKDIITGNRGIVMCRVEYLTSCTHVGLLLVDKKSHRVNPDWEYVDERRCVCLKSKKFSFDKENNSKQKKDIGGPQQTPNIQL
jgi:hypothetical protein